MRLTSYNCGFAKWGVVSETTVYNSDRNLHQMIVNHIISQHSPFPWHTIVSQGAITCGYGWLCKNNLYFTETVMNVTWMC